MPRPYKPLIPQNVGEIMDKLGSMMLSAPTFNDPYFTERSVETEFSALNEGLAVVRGNLGEERYAKLIDLSNRMRAHFEAGAAPSHRQLGSVDDAMTHPKQRLDQRMPTRTIGQMSAGIEAKFSRMRPNRRESAEADMEQLCDAGHRVMFAGILQL